MLDKLGGVYAPRPSCGPHKLRESLPLVVMLRNRLKYALTRDEVTKIVMQRTIKVDGKVRTDSTYPAGFMGEFSNLSQIFILFSATNFDHFCPFLCLLLSIFPVSIFFSFSAIHRRLVQLEDGTKIPLPNGVRVQNRGQHYR